MTSDAGGSAPAAQAQFRSPQINLPKGGGAIRGIGEKFATDALTGTGSATIPLAVTGGRSGFTPQLSLTYDSGAGNGVFGVGWSISGPSITRKTDKGLPQYRDAEESDVFILSGSEDLVPILHWQHGRWCAEEVERAGYRVKRYRPRVEGVFARIERWTRVEDGDIHWRSFSKDNVLTLYGVTHESRIYDPANKAHVFSWLISSSFDDKGNAIDYEYVAEDERGVDRARANERHRTRTANRYLRRVRYGNRRPLRQGEGCDETGWMFEVMLDYGDGVYCAEPPDEDGNVFISVSGNDSSSWPVRDDPFSRYRSGFEVRTYRLCHRVLLFHCFPEELGTPRYLVQSTQLEYEQKRIGSFLTRAIQSGYVQISPDRYLRKSMPALELSYSKSPLEAESFDSCYELRSAAATNLPQGIDGRDYRWLDLDGVGIPGVLTEQDSGWYYNRNRGKARLDRTELLRSKPAGASLAAGQEQLLDLAGDGNLDLVDLTTGMVGFYGRAFGGRGWEPFRVFRSMPVLEWEDPNLRFLDLTGDGIADVLITEDIAYRWHPSYLRAGFGAERRVPRALDEELGPRVVFNDGTESIYLADMSGDGLSDIVRIRNGEVCYWPNLGYGRFGAKVTMDHAPWLDLPDSFDQKRVRLADTDGSGTTDILYVGPGGVDIYLNHSGNGWSSRRALDNMPTGDLTTISVADFLGRGTACLVWSSPLPRDAQHPLRYVDLMRGQKPHLLTRVRNNLGAETLIEYASSTEFYLADEAAGRPWITRLPFPVHVVKRVETRDLVSRNRFVSHKTYHHGYFDGIEREFRGFGRVEQIDTEDFGILTKSGEPSGEQPYNEHSSWNVPPVLTKTWFHTGVFIGGGRVSRHLAREYYREPHESAEMVLDDTIIPPGLTAEEAREACRSLKGSMLRQEVYALDGTEPASRPYAASESNLTVRCLQPREWNRHAVFFTHARESINFSYERKLFDVEGVERADPRVAHSVTLQVDDYGNILKAASIAYARRFPAAECREQAKTLLTYTESDYTHPVREQNAYRNPLPAEARAYELYNLRPDAHRVGTTHLFRFEEIARKIASAGDGQHNVPYEDLEAAGAFDGAPCRRLFQRTRTVYRSNALDRLLPPGELQSLALPGEVYQLTLTPGLLRDVYQRQHDGTVVHLLGEAAAAALQEGGYVDLDRDGHWWAPSGRVFYSPESHEAPEAELAVARRHFFLPRRVRDPFGNVSHATYDAHDLAVTATRDAAGNTVTALTDYRVLAPRLVTDANGNRTASAFDALGMLVGSAIMGKQGDGEGDSLDGFVADLSERTLLEHLRHPLRDAHEILRRATTRFLYDLFAFARTQGDQQPQPSVAYTMTRETHESDLAAGERTKIQHSFAYSDGLGRICQKKGQAAPGALLPSGPEVDARWVGTGWAIFNNKGKPIRQFEPFFSDTHAFEFARIVGVSSTLFYDPVGRVVATLHPEHTYEKVVFDPWQQVSWDVSDTVLEHDPAEDRDVGAFFRRVPREEYLPTWYAQRRYGGRGEKAREAAEQAARHVNTPTYSYLDTLGRSFLTIRSNRLERNGKSVEQRLATHVALDIEGQQLRITDSLGREAGAYVYDLTSKAIFQRSGDAGDRWTFLDVSGKTLRVWDSRGFESRHVYDMLRRSTHLFVRQDHAAEKLAEKTVYGEQAPQSLARNLRGKPFQYLDGAGIATNSLFDFKGNLAEGDRRLLRDYHDRVDWNAAPGLEASDFKNGMTYDALNRPTSITTPDRSVIRLHYDPASRLDNVGVRLRGVFQLTPFVTGISYNAKGQREFIALGNGVRTHYAYDPMTFRLTHLETLRGKHRTRLQDLHYTYDPVGNITSIADHAQQTVYFDNQVVTASNDYIYDALYRLIEAHGREHAGVRPTNWSDAPQMNQPLPTDGQAMRRYKEEYGYDPVGNILDVIHHAADEGWHRHYEYSSLSNRLERSRVGEVPERYEYDGNGNMLRMPHLPTMEWDFKNQLHVSGARVAHHGHGERTFYVYDSGGKRLRKVTERADGSRAHERIYIGGIEIYREYGRNKITLERETLQVMDDKHRIALVETKTVDKDSPPGAPPEVLIRYQLSNHLESSCLELDEAAEIISYEEYYPYGSTSYEAAHKQIEASPKRYRFIGKERDRETGLYACGLRYYASWLGRWTSSDPKGMADGTNLYQYCSGNPVMLNDPNGTDGETSEAEDAANACLVDPSTSEPTPEEDAAQASLASEHPMDDSSDSSSGTPSFIAAGVELARFGISTLVGPTDTAGNRLEGTFYLWSGQVNKDAAKAAIAANNDGFLMNQTPQHVAAEAEFAAALRREADVMFPGNTFTNAELFSMAGTTLKLPTAEMNAIWGPPSAEVARLSVLGGNPVQQNLVTSPGAGTIQSEFEIPAVQGTGAAMSLFPLAAGGANIYGGIHEQDPTLKTLGVTGGAIEVGGGLLSLAGALRASAPLASLGGKAFVVGSIITAPVVLSHAADDLRSDDPSRQLIGGLNATGVVLPPAAFLGAYEEYFVKPAAETFYETARGAVAQWLGVPMSMVY